jgi:hypothetical protein
MSRLGEFLANEPPADGGLYLRGGVVHEYALNLRGALFYSILGCLLPRRRQSRLLLSAVLSLICLGGRHLDLRLASLARPHLLAKEVGDRRLDVETTASPTGPIW